MRLSILHRYFLVELVKVFFLVLGCLFGLYVIIDYTSRAAGLGLGFVELSQYYAFIFIDRLDVLMPFALLLAGIKTLCQSNLRQELVAMRASGYSMPRLLLPLVWVGIVATGLVYINTQWLLPHSLQRINRIEDKYAAEESRGNRQMVHNLPLNDGSRLLYVTYDRARQRFVQTYWLRSFDDVYRIRYLSPESLPPIGLVVDHLQRDDQGRLLPIESAAEMQFPEMQFDMNDLSEALMMPSERSLTQLWLRLPTSSDMSFERGQIEAAFYKKVAMPWLCIIALLAPTTFCVAYRRPLRVFMIFAVSIFGLFGFFIWLSVGHTLAQSQLANPLYTLILPTAFATLLSTLAYRRLR